jgi:hypothetical protein
MTVFAKNQTFSDKSPKSLKLKGIKITSKRTSPLKLIEKSEKIALTNQSFMS